MDRDPKLRCIQNNPSTQSHGAGVLPTPIEKVKSKAVASLVTAIGEMFDKADDTLFQMADRAETNAEQNTYFESMREIRVKRRGMESAFRQELLNCFGVMPNVEHREEVEGGLNSVSADSLSLVQNDELEENVALDGMVSKTRSRMQSSLSALHIRFDTLMPTVRVDEKNNPLDPKQVCTAFSQASGQFDLEIKAKLILFKLFEKSVLAQLETVVDAANTELVSQGILPDLKVSNSYQYRRPRQVNAPGQNRSAPPSPYQDSMDNQHFGDAGFSDQMVGEPLDDPYAKYDRFNPSSGYTGPSGFSGAGAGAGHGEQRRGVPVDGKTEVFNMLQGLLAQTGQGGGQPGVNPGGGAIVLQRHELMSVLSELQHQPEFQEGSLEQVNNSGMGMAAFNVRQAISGLLDDAKGHYSGKSLEKNDDDVINLVAMLFEFILGDPNLPETIKVLLGRLQIPILKVAITDKSFFSKSGHSARKLVNELAKAGIGVSDQAQHAQDKLQKKITDIVDRICNDFEDDLALFDELLTDFLSFVQKEAKRAELIEKRTKDAEEGRAKTENARHEVEVIVAEKTNGRVLPQVVSILLHEAWSNVLFLIVLKEGVESENWKASLNTVDDLIWSVEHRETASDRQKLMRLVPDLLKRLKEGLSTISYNHFEMSKLFDELEKVHVQCLRGRKPGYLVEYEKNQQHNAFADIPLLQPDPALNTNEENAVEEAKGKETAAVEQVEQKAEAKPIPPSDIEIEKRIAEKKAELQKELENTETEKTVQAKAEQKKTAITEQIKQPEAKETTSIETTSISDDPISADEAQSIAAELDSDWDLDLTAVESSAPEIKQQVIPKSDPADALIEAISKDLESPLGDNDKTSSEIVFDSAPPQVNQQAIAERAKAAEAALNSQHGIPNQPIPEPVVEDLPADDEHVQLVATLAVGHWVEFVGEDEEAGFRCKLAARLQSADKLIFVNRLGIKVAEKSSQQLAQELKAGEAKILSDRLLFDRALEALIGNLREQQPH